MSKQLLEIKEITDQYFRLDHPNSLEVKEPGQWQ